VQQIEAEITGLIGPIRRGAVGRGWLPCRAGRLESAGPPGRGRRGSFVERA
jgi:hypothetical protein